MLCVCRRFPVLLAGAAVLLAASSVAWPSRPTLLAAFSLSGESLGLGQRDFRVFNNFTDAETNDNTIPHPNFPGHTGAVMAIWKAHAEWGSEPRGGNGLGDGLASNANIGDGGANFDNTFQGAADGLGGTNDNIHVASPSLGGSVITLTELPAADGWKIVYSDAFLWDDGPGAPGKGALDLQSVATHEIGHVLGLGHSSVFSATMAATINGDGTGARSLAPDDIAGLQAIYGVKSASKPHIAAVSGTLAVGDTLDITGSNFAALGNEVWFTSAAADGTPVKLTGVFSGGGGTQISIVIPPGAAAGDVLVHTPGSGGASLSNAFPLDVGSLPGSYDLTAPSLAGAGGQLPQLTGAGDLTPGGGAPLQLFVQLVAPGASGALFIALTEANLPFKGGTFDPAPILAQVSLTADAEGKVVLPATMPAGLPSGTRIVTQAWWADTAAVQGFSSTNGLALVVP